MSAVCLGNTSELLRSRFNYSLAKSHLVQSMLKALNTDCERKANRFVVKTKTLAKCRSNDSD